jgi:hypothetical protein
VIPIAQLGRIVHHAAHANRRHLLLFRLYCDESHDSPKQKGIEPRSYVVGGFFGTEPNWTNVERRWSNKNQRVHVARYHASHLNAGTYEYNGWNKQRRLRYSKDMLQILKDQRRKLHGFGYGLYVDEYRQIVSPSGQKKMGHPYLICFKSMIASVARQMDDGHFPLEDTFAVILDQKKDEVDGRRLDAEATRIFYGMKDNPKFAYRHRLETCTPADSNKVVCLQTADFVAYEICRLMHGERSGTDKVRDALNSMLGTTNFMCEMFNAIALERIRDGVEATQCEDNGLVVVPLSRPREPSTSAASEVSSDGGL